MRALSFAASAVLVLVLACAGADASIFNRAHPASAGGGKGSLVKGADLQRRHHGHGRAVGDGFGDVYEMAYDLLAAFQTRNYTWAASLIADDAIIEVTSFGCGTQTKQQLLAAAEGDTSLATYFQFGSYAGYKGSAMAAVGTIGAITGASSGTEANQTYIINDAMFFFVPNQDGTQLSVIKRFLDRSYMQPNNASAMGNVWKQMADAANIHDVAGFAAVLTEEAHLEVNYAWDQFPQFALPNKTAIVRHITESWAVESKFGVKTTFAMVACNYVLAQFTWSAVRTDGSASIMNFVIKVDMNDNFKVTQITEYPMMPFM